MEQEPDLSARPVVLVTGASGALGRRVAELAIASGAAAKTILVTRRPDLLAHLAAADVEVRAGDFDRADTLADAFAGAERLLLVSASDVARRAEQHRAAIRAAAEAGVRHVVYTSMLSPEPPNPALIAPSHHATEQALERSGLAWTVLRNSLYAEYQVPEALQARAGGVLGHNRGAGRIAYVSREDCAAAAAAVLLSAGHEHRRYRVTGPEAFDARSLAALYAELGGRAVEAVDLADDVFTEQLSAAFGDDDHARYGAELVASLGRAAREGRLAEQTDDVATLTGRPARRLRDVLAEGLR